ncbi:hypothetical protein MAR_023909 [Mya arenaria]|uniref:Uncharacterized protein n=1 Tax=Mya arenaria TaxID=6604 RepID=A0ABY7DRN0_MYAAR|nr:hypothetical protein MAR_023909 [Mya arenaria]
MKTSLINPSMIRGIPQVFMFPTRARRSYTLTFWLSSLMANRTNL